MVVQRLARLAIAITATTSVGSGLTAGADVHAGTLAPSTDIDRALEY